MSPTKNGVFAIKVNLLTFTCTMHFPFLPRFGLGSLSSRSRFSPELISLCVVGFRILLRPPSSMAIIYNFLWYYGARREGLRKGSCEGQNQGEFPHTVLSTSSIISAFLCGSPPFKVYFIFVGFNQERNIKLVACSRHL